MRDVWISVYTDAQTISNYKNKILLNYVCYTQVLQLTPLSVTINPAYGASCNICTCHFQCNCTKMVGTRKNFKCSFVAEMSMLLV